MWQRSFQEQGFAIFPAMLAASEVRELLDDLSQLPLDHRRAGIRHTLGRPNVSRLAHDRRLLSIAQQVLGPQAFPFRATLFNKSPGRNWLIPWHQDTALPLREQHDMAGWGPWSVKAGILYAHAPATALQQVIALRVHLDESGLQNGPLRVLPGTHNMGVLSDDEIHRLSIHTTEVSCITPCGGVLAMRPLLIHSSSKSEDETDRRVLHIEYAACLMFADGMRLAVA